MSKLYLRLPPSSVAAELAGDRNFVCRYALVDSGKLEREGVAALSELSATLAKVERVILLVAANDVVLLRLKVPPLSSSRLKSALPNLVEDHVIGDPAECAIAAGGAGVDGMRTVGVVQRKWLETIAQALARYEVRRTVAVPAQLCLPCTAGAVSVAVETQGDGLQVTLRLSEHEGFGIAMPAASRARDVLETVGAVAQDAPLALYVPEASLDEYRGAIAADASGQPARLAAESWSCWLAGAEAADIDLFSGSTGAPGSHDRGWRDWRWPAALAAGVLAVNLIGLYSEWWQMKSESDRLRASMVQTFRSAYPTETVILDPLAQMKQKVALSRRASGELARDDFLVELSAFADAWTRTVPAQGDDRSARIAALEFRDRSLIVRTEVEAPEAIASELRARGFSLARASTGTWQLRSIP